MAITGIYEQGGLVCIEDDVHGISRITWREAMERCKAVAEVELRLSAAKRESGIQNNIEQMVRAAVAARKKTQPGWEPPGSVLGFTIGVAPSRIIIPG